MCEPPAQLLAEVAGAVERGEHVQDLVAFTAGLAELETASGSELDLAGTHRPTVRGLGVGRFLAVDVGAGLR